MTTMRELSHLAERRLRYAQRMEWERDTARRDLAEARAEISADDFLLAERDRLMDAIPECSAHGSRCVPGAIEWVEESKMARAALREAAEAVRLLLRWVRIWHGAEPRGNCAEAWRALPAWMRKEIER